MIKEKFLTFYTKYLLLALISICICVLPCYSQDFGTSPDDTNPNLDVSKEEQLKDQQLQEQLFKKYYNENKSFYPVYKSNILKQNDETNQEYIDGKKKYNQHISNFEKQEDNYFNKYKLYNKDFDWYNYREEKPDADYSYDDSYYEDYDDGSDVSP